MGLHELYDKGLETRLVCMYNEWDLLGGATTVFGRKLPITAVMAAGVMLLGGCESLGQKPWTPQQAAAVSLDEDGKITEIIQETLGAAYYDAAELQNMVTSEVADYNAKHGADTIKVISFEAADGKVTLKMEYASAGDYAEFNNTEFYYGSMINAQLSGYLFDVSYKRVSDGVVQGGPVSGTQVIKGMDKQVLVLRAPMEVQVPGEILYTSTNADVLSANVVNATGQQEEAEDEGLVLPSNAVYKAKDKATFAETAAANRVYIVFDLE